MTVALYHPHLRAGVRQRLLTLSGLPAVAWQGETYRPVVGTPYITEAFVPVASQTRAGYQVHTDLATFTLHYPIGAGTLPIETMAGQLLTHFKPGTKIEYTSAAAIVDEAERGPAQQGEDWIDLTVTISLLGSTEN